MSHGRHNASSEVAHLVAEVRRTPSDQLEEVFGILISEDKTVYDYAYETKFKNVNEWAVFVVSQEIDEWDDEYGEDSRWDEEE